MALSVGFSLAFACAVPLAALSTVAGLNISRRGAIILVLAAWFANQVVGYVVLGYPQTWDSFGWGTAIGIAAMLSALAAVEFGRRVEASAKIAIAFVVAFVIYEIVLFAATAALPSGVEAFSSFVIVRIFWINVLALVGLLLLHRLVLYLGLLGTTKPTPARSTPLAIPLISQMHAHHLQ